MGLVPLDLLLSYLYDRRHSVCYDGGISHPLDTTNGIPHGSILGPLLFIIYLNDLPVLSNEKHISYADDITYFSVGADMGSLSQERDLTTSLLTQRLDWNSLKINQNKTQHITFALYGTVPLHSDLKLLGIYLDPTLSWTSHKNHLKKHLTRTVYLIRNLAAKLSNPVLKQIYHAFFQSRLIYGTVLWGNAGVARDLLPLQKRVIRLLSGIGYREHCRE